MIAPQRQTGRWAGRRRPHTWLLRIKEEGRHVATLQLIPPCRALSQHLRLLLSHGAQDERGGSRARPAAAAAAALAAADRRRCRAQGPGQHAVCWPRLRNQAFQHRGCFHTV